MPIKDPLEREFYATLCVNEGWSVRVLRERRNSMLYERTAISKKPEETIKNGLLFCHRGLNRLVVIDLKIGKFKPADKGQIELYLRYLEKNEMRPGENKPIALILCADKSEEAVLNSWDWTKEISASRNA